MSPGSAFQRGFAQGQAVTVGGHATQQLVAQVEQGLESVLDYTQSGPSRTNFQTTRLQKFFA
jgi:hypothetical protein